MRNNGVSILAAVCAGIIGIVLPENASCTDSALARLSAAEALPCSTAIAVYKSLSADTTAPDSIRSRAFGLLGDYGFAQGMYETARDSTKRNPVMSIGRDFHIWPAATPPTQ